MDEKVTKQTEMKIEVSLNKDRIPIKIRWQAEDKQSKNEWTEAKALALSLFEENSRETFKIDLWTHKMQVNEMDRFVFNTLKGLADSYFNATKNQPLANDFQNFILHFGKSTKII